MHVEMSMIPHSSAAAAAARKKGRICLFPACPPASSSREREREREKCFYTVPKPQMYMKPAPNFSLTCVLRFELAV
jgi:hypothetical protein